MAGLEITLSNVSNLEKEDRLFIIKEIRKECSLSLDDIKNNITNELPISVIYVSEKLINFLQEKNAGIKIKLDNESLSIDEYLDLFEEYDEYDDDEEGKYKDFLPVFIGLIIGYINYNIKNDNLLSEKKNDYINGQLTAYSKLLEFLKEHAISYGIDGEVLKLMEIDILNENNIK
ncbi:hypothetical protein R84B8_01656 [Treponema sp. R8-4-B8]